MNPKNSDWQLTDLRPSATCNHDQLFFGVDGIWCLNCGVLLSETQKWPDTVNQNE